MKKQYLEFFVGLFVLLGLAAVLYLTVKLGSGSSISGPMYEIEARFANAGSLNAGASVLVAGVPVGRVESIRVDPQDYSAIITLRLTKELKLPTDTMASIKTTGLIGDKYLLLAPGADETHLKAGDRITLTESAVDLEGLIGKMAFGNISKPGSESSTPATTPASP
jgi:phospholipid/cholesterol/gamma-HCH transport system substrate-binding protein